MQLSDRKMLLTPAFVTLRHPGHHPGRNQKEFQGLLPGTSSSFIPKSGLPLQKCPFLQLEADPGRESLERVLGWEKLCFPKS